jgi:perosamine synthetase
MARMIFTGLSPNAERDDVALAASILFRPWTWIQGEGRGKLEAAVSSRLNGASAFAFTSGRGALAAILEAFDFDPGSEILLQAYACVVVPNAIHWTGYRPVFVDVDDSLNMDPADLERKITTNCKAIIIQHTFGCPADLSRLIAIARKHGLAVIEDCAHALGATFEGRPVGAFGDAAFFSFGRDKVISSVFGGCAVTPRRDIAEKLKDIHVRAGDASRTWVVRQIIHPIVLALIKATYAVGIGRVIFVLVKKLRIVSLSIHRAERTGQRPKAMSRRLPNALALMAIHQLEKVDHMNAHRRVIAAAYARELAGVRAISTQRVDDPSSSVCIRYTIFSSDAERLIAEARTYRVLLGDWYRTVIAPKGTEAIAGYEKGSCPVAERLAVQTVNLPTDVHITKEDAVRVAKVVRKIIEGIREK